MDRDRAGPARPPANSFLRFRGLGSWRRNSLPAGAARALTLPKAALPARARLTALVLVSAAKRRQSHRELPIPLPP